METKTILLWLEAPLQSWGYDSKFNRRDTLEFPTKSGVLGLVLCAMGASGEQKELLARFATLKQTVVSFHYVDGKGNAEQKQPLLHDFQMIGSGYDENDLWQKNLIPKTAEGKSPVGGGTKLTHRYYLQNAIFAVLFEVPADLSDAIAESLKNPVYPIYLGRRCCVPTDFIFQGIFSNETDAEEAAIKKADEKSNARNTAEKYSKQWKLKEEFKVIDGDSEDGDAFTLNDVSIQFGTQKLYKDRRVTKIFVDSDK